VLCVDGVQVEEEGSADKALGKEVGSESRERFEGVEAGAGFEHKEGDRLLDEQTDNDGPPLVPRRHPETKLKRDETHDGDRAISIIHAL